MEIIMKMNVTGKSDLKIKQLREVINHEEETKRIESVFFRSHLI